MNERYFQFGRFRVLSEIKRGAGEEGAIYKAVCEEDGFDGVAVGTMVALKTVKVESEDHRVQLQSYAQELMKLVHPGVERCLGYFVEDDAKDRFSRHGVFVFEWLEGESLKERLRRESSGLDADEVLRIGEKLLSACAYVLTKGVVHRDIKSGNVFLCHDGEVKLVDFKIPFTLHVYRWTENCKYDYEASEFHYTSLDSQGVRLKDGDEQSDLFSVGVCLHEMLTGRLPYMPVDDSHFGANRFASFFWRWKHIKDGNDPIVVCPLVNRLLAGAADVLTKALQPKRAERYATFADFAAAFKGMHYRELTHGGVTWRLLQYVGRGGFGEVFKARNVKTGQVVAIKHLLNCQYADRFKREARALSRLQEPGIVRFITYFEDEFYGSGAAFLVMEYLDGMPGRSLRDELKRAGGKPVPRTLALRAFARYAHGLSVMHAKGLVHRDIKPSNLYFPQEAIERAVIMDLAIVRDVNGTMTVGRTPCTPDYAPPEIAISESRGDAGMDTYALGLSLYEALTGKMAYPRLPTGTSGMMTFLERARNKTRPNLDESSYSDQPDLVWLVREMTEPDVTKRLKDAAEVERRLGALLSENVTVDYRVDDTDPQTLYAAPSYEELELESNNDEASTIDDSTYYWNSDEGKKAFARQRRKQWLVQMCSYLLKGLVIMAALLVLSGAFVGLFWWGESCVRDILPGLKGSLAVRVLVLFPWLICLFWKEMKTGRLPNVLNLGCLLTGLGVAVFTNGVSLLSAIGAAVAGSAALLPFFLIHSAGAGDVKIFAAVLPFWGVQMVPYAFGSVICMWLATCLMGTSLRSKLGFGVKRIAFSPIVLLSMMSVAVSLGFWNGHGMLGGYIFMAGTLVLASVARLLFRERKQHAEVVSTPSSVCTAETSSPREDIRTVTSNGSESQGLLDATCRTSDLVTSDLVSETEDGTDDPSAFLNLHGHATIHGFRLDPSPLVAEGGQGRVFKAECVEDGRLGLHKGEVVALKFVEETDASPSFEEFQKAVAYLREIKSPHIPRYYGCFRVERRVNGKLKRFRMTVMEYLDGADLGYRVKVRSPMFYADEIMYVLDQLLEGLCELSAAGIVHRDIKPSNVFVCRDGTVKLIDFDTALIRGIDLCPKNRKIVGTPEFAAPDYLAEGFRGDEISEVFSVGMTLYYMVHGVSPHRAKGTLSGRMNETAFRAFWDKHQKESGNQAWWKWDEKNGGDWLSGDARPYVPLLGLQRLFERCLTADRNRRLTSWGEFREFLENVEFICAKCGGAYVRVISDCQSVSGVGDGHVCIYWRDETGCVQDWGFGGFDIVCFNADDRHILVWILGDRIYDSDAPAGISGSIAVGDGHREHYEHFVKTCHSRLDSYIRHEKFVSCNVEVLRKSFAEIKSLEKWQSEVADHEFQMQLS